MFHAGHTDVQIAAHVLIGGFFLVMLVKNASLYRWNVERMGAAGTPFPEIVLPTGFAIQFAGAVMMLIDWQADIAAVMLIVFVVTATVIHHRYWEMTDPVRRNYHMLLLGNNVAICAGLLLAI